METRHCPAVPGWTMVAMVAAVQGLLAREAFLWHFLIYEHLDENLVDVLLEVCRLL